MALPFAIPALVSVAQAGLQYAQAKKQDKLAKQLQPSDYVPNALKEAEATARLNTNALPVGYNRSLELGQRSTSNAIDAAKKVGGGADAVQAAVADADAREKELIKDLGVAASAEQRANRADLTNILSDRARFEKMSQDAYSAAVSALKGASMQNKYNAVTGLGQNLIYGAGMSGLGSNKTGGSGDAWNINNKPVSQQGAFSQLPPAPGYSPGQEEFLKKFNWQTGAYDPYSKR